MLEVRLIGKFDIQSDGNPVILSSRAAQSLFAYLILTAGTLHRREKLAGMLWPDESEQKARAYLRNELWRIRTAISQASKAEYLVADNLTAGFDHSSPYWLDIAGLKKLSDTSSAEELMQALSSYQGELLPGFYEDWVILEREHLQVLFEQKIACLLEILEKEQRWHDILEWAERWIVLGQGPEAAYRTLMVAYDTLGDHAKVASTYERCKQALRQLDLEPSEETRALALKRNPKLNIPIPLTSFIGREQELKEVAELLSKSRLVTLTGSGGVGKTRLAIQVVAEVLNMFPDGVWYLDLAPLTDPALVPQLILTTLGLIEQVGRSPVAILTDFLQTRRALFILDNCEHLVQACSQLAETLLLACPTLHILTTSREALRVAGEFPYRVPSLEIPGPEIESDIDSLAKVEAVRLFTERAAVVSPDFAVGPQNVLIVAQICRRLDGIPLAVELAAARTNMLSVQQILKRLDSHFNFLTMGIRTAPPRHQTLRATIEWSYDLLTEKERLLFHRLAIFMGGWTLEAAEQVCVGDDIESSDVLDLLSQLVNKSLVLVENLEDENRNPTGGLLRYRSLETIRQFARKKLTESGEEERFRNNHLHYFLQWAETAQPQLYSQLVWLKRIEAEHNNVGTALQWATEHGAGELGLRLATALEWLWVECGHVAEGWEWFDRLLRSSDSLPIALRAKALKEAGHLAAMTGHYRMAQVMLRESLQLLRGFGDKHDTAATLNTLGLVTIWLGEHLEAKAVLEESLEQYQDSESSGKALALLRLGTVMYLQGDYTRAQVLCEESLTLAQKQGNRLLMAWVFKHLGNLAQRQGNIEKAVELLEKSLAFFQEFRHLLGLIAYLEGMAEVAGLKGQQERLVRLFGAAAESHIKLGIMPFSAEQVEYERQLAIARTQLGLNLFDMAWESGRQMSLDEAVTYALKDLQ